MCISVQYSEVTYMYFDFFLNVEAFELGSEIKSLWNEGEEIVP